MDEKRFLRLMRVVKVSLIVVLAYIGLQVVATRRHVGSLLEPGAVCGDEHPPDPTIASTPVRPSQDYADIVQRNLFSGGYPQGGSSRSQTIDSLASAEGLGLKLSGTIAGGPAVSRAIIENTKDKTVGLYKVGDTIGSATVESIQRDAVVLGHQGRQLVLKRQAGASGSSAMTAREGRPSATAGAPVAVAQAVPLPLAANSVEDIFREVRIEPYVKNKRTQGLRLSGLENVPLAERLGLKNGDVIQAINGQHLTNKQKAFQVLAKARTQSKVNIQLLRDGRSKDLSLTF